MKKLLLFLSFSILINCADLKVTKEEEISNSIKEINANATLKICTPYFMGTHFTSLHSWLNSDFFASELLLHVWIWNKECLNWEENGFLGYPGWLPLSLLEKFADKKEGDIISFNICFNDKTYKLNLKLNQTCIEDGSDKWEEAFSKIKNKYIDKKFFSYYTEDEKLLRGLGLIK